MNSPQKPAHLPSDNPEHAERIAAIRERAQRHAQRSARLFAHPPEIENSDLLPVPSLLAVACSVALANQAQAQATQVSDQAELNDALNTGKTNIELTQDITTSREFNSLYKSNIDGKNHTVTLNGNSDLNGFLSGSGQKIGNISNITIQNGRHLLGQNNTGGIIDGFSNSIITGDITNSHFINSQASYSAGAIRMTTINGNIKKSSFIGNEAGVKNASGAGGALFIDNAINGDIENTEFKDNKAAHSGGAIWITSINGNIKGSSFIGNSAGGSYGGAIYVNAGINGNIENTLFEANEAKGAGGAIRSARDIKGVIRDSQFINNKSTGSHGGALYIHGDIEGGIEGSTFEGNTAQLDGGAIDITKITGGIRGSQFINNQSITGVGGAIYTNTISSGIENTLFENNSSKLRGGAINASGNIKDIIRDSQFINNKSTESHGGALHVSGDIEDGIEGSTFENNTAQLNGGAIDVTAFTGGIRGSEFINNNSIAGTGGAVLVWSGVLGGISGSTFKDNSAGGIAGTMGGGGAVSVIGSIEGGIQDSIFENNKALHTLGAGGAIYTNTINGGIENTLFKNNTALERGGAIYATITGTIRNSEFIDNKSTDSHGGALYLTGDLDGGIENSKFEGNTAHINGGALDIKTFTGSIRGSQFIDNHSTTGSGGAVWVYDGVLNGISGSTFKDNSAGGTTGGGAVSVDGSINGGIQGSTFENNEALHATGTGGAIRATTAINGGIQGTEFTGNTAGDSGGAIFTVNLEGGISDSSFTGNEALNSGGGAIHAHNGTINGGIKNTVFKDNTANNNGGAIWATNIGDGISDSTFTGNKALNSGGGAIHVSNTLAGGITNSIFTENTANNQGAAIWTANIKGGINGTEFRDNTSTNGYGGAIYTGNLEDGISDSKFIGNKAANGLGGAIYSDKLIGNINNSIFTDNIAQSAGGAIWTNHLDGSINHSTFTGNTADEFGGAVRAYEIITGGINNSIFRKNSSGDLGGAIAVSKTSVTSQGVIVGGISGSTFEENTAANQGGAIWTKDINGDISGSTFTQNAATTEHGGAIWVNSITGNISSSTFSENTAGKHGGALFLAGTSANNNTIINSTFSHNTAGDMGAAVYQETGGTLNVSDSRFVGNIAQASGGAIKSGILSIKNSEFIGNQGVSNTTPTSTGLAAGVGGAVLSQGQLDIENSVFLGNSSFNRGGAIHHHHDTNGTQEIRIVGGADKTLFFGNQETNTGRYSSFEFSHTRDNLSNVTIHADKGAEGNSGVLMLDAMQSVNNQNVTYSPGSVLNIKKTGDGDWFLGGNSLMIHPGAWTIEQGRLALTDVDYDGSGAEQARIHLQNGAFNLENGAALEGQGTILAGEINLKGAINPNVWRNTGMLANQITTGISQADVDSIQTVADKADSFATITLDTKNSGNAVIMDGATYEVGVAWKDNGAGGFDAQSDLLDVKGELKVENNSGINITRLDFDEDWALARIQGGGSEPAAQVIKTTGGINGAFNVQVAGGLAPSSDFLKVRGEQVGNDYEVRLGLAWFSKERDPSRTAVSGDSVMDAHGGFTVDAGGSFTIGGALAKRTDVPNFIDETTEAGGAAGWDGNSLTKRGDGTLILNADNTYDGLTKIDGGTLVLGDSAANAGARVGGDVQINNGAIFDGYGRAKGNVTVENGGQFTGFGGADGLLHVKNGGLLAPGNAATGDMGTVDAGRLQIDAGGTYRVKTDASGGSDLVNVANDATIHGGTVEVNAKNGNWGKRGTQHTRTIIQSGGQLTGAFDKVTSDLAFLTPKLDYNNNQVILGLSRNSTKMEDIADGSTRNRINTAEGLGDLEASGTNPTLINELLGLNKDDALRAFDSLSGEIYPTTSTVLLQSSNQLRTRVNTRLTANTQGTADVSSFNGIRALNASDTGTSTPVWVSTWGHTGNQGRTPNAARADISGNGVLLGIDNTDRPVAGGLHAGMMFGSERTKIDIADDRNSRSEVDSRSVGVYGGSGEQTQWRGGLIYSDLDMQTQRTVTVNSLTERVSSERKGKQMQAFAEISHNLTLSHRTSVAPWLNVAKVWQQLDPTTESGGVTALEIEKQSASATLTSVGGRGQVNLNEGRIPVAFYADVGYQYVLDSKNNDSKHHFAGQTQDFAVRGTTLNDTLVSGVGMQFGVSRNSALLVEYRGEFGSGQKQHMGNISWQVKF